MENRSKYDKGNGIHNVPLWRIIGFCGGNLATNMYMGLTMFMAYYLNGFVGMAVILASSFSTIMRLWDGITDPIIGFVIDKFGAKIGKTRFCLVCGGIITFAASCLMFNVTHRLPEGGVVRSVFFTVFALLFYIGYTFLNVSMHTGSIALTNDPKQRPLMTIFGTTLVRIARALMQVFMAGLVVKYGTMVSTELFHDFWLLSATLASVFIVIAYISIAPKDIPKYTTISEGSTEKIKVSDYWRVLKENRPLQMMIVANATDKLAVTCKTSAISVVLFGVVAGNFALNGGWTLYTTIIGLIMLALGVGAIGSKFGLKTALQVGSAGTLILDILAVLLWTFGDPKTLNLPGYTNGYGEAFSGFTFFTVALFLITVMGSGCQMISSGVIVPMIADVNDYEASRSGKYIPGMVGTIFSFLDKLISSFGPLLVGVGFAVIGFKDKLPDVNTPYSQSLFWVAIVFFYGLEILGVIFNLIAMKFYKLSPEVMADVKVKVEELRRQENEQA